MMDEGRKRVVVIMAAILAARCWWCCWWEGPLLRGWRSASPSEIYERANARSGPMS